MKYHILLGILLWTVAAALAQLSAPAPDTSLSPDAKRSAPALKGKPSSHGKSGKPAVPLAQPEPGEENEVQDDPEEDKESADCDGCMLAGASQAPAAYAVAE
jgi:hypothetical protein